MFNPLSKLTVFSVFPFFPSIPFILLFLLFQLLYSDTASSSPSNISFITTTGNSEKAINSIVRRIKKIRRLITKKNYRLALKETHSAIIWNKEVPILYTLEGTIYFLLGKYAQAKTSWVKSLKTKSDNLQSKILLKKIEQKLRN